MYFFNKSSFNIAYNSFTKSTWRNEKIMNFRPCRRNGLSELQTAFQSVSNLKATMDRGCHENIQHTSVTLETMHIVSDKGIIVSFNYSNPLI